MPSVLAIEPDAKQAKTLQATIRRHVAGELTLVDSKDAAIDVIARGVPDLILLSALLSPTDEQELMGHLRTLDAPHLQTLTVPLLAVPSSSGRPRGLLKRFKKSRAKSLGCDPKSFATQITEYLDKAAALKAERAEFENFAAQRAARGDEAPAESAASEEPLPEALAGESSDLHVATAARGSQSGDGVHVDSSPVEATAGAEPTLRAATPEVSDALGLREVEQQREQARRDADAAAQAVREAERQREEAERARAQARRDAEAAARAASEAEQQHRDAEQQAREQAARDAEAVKHAIREAERQREEAERVLEQTRRDAKTATRAAKEAEQQRKQAELLAWEQAARDAEAATQAIKEAEQQRQEAERARAQAKRDAEAAKQAAKEAEHQRKAAEQQARAQAKRDAEAAEHAAKNTERQRKEVEREAHEQATKDAEAAAQAVREAERQRQEAERAREQAKRDAKAATQAAREAERQRKIAEKRAREQTQLVAKAAELASVEGERQREDAERARKRARRDAEAAEQAAKDAERQHKKAERQAHQRAAKDAEAAAQAVREAERQREEAERARERAVRDAEAAELAAQEAERQRQAAETLRAQATRDAEAAERVAREAREQARREVEAGRNQELAKQVAANSRQGKQTNAWERMSRSAIPADEVTTAELPVPVVDGEIVTESSAQSQNAAPSALAADPLLEALDSELEELVEVVGDAPATPAGVAPSPPPDSDPSSAAGQSWLLRTIGKLRTDLSDFQRPTKVRDEAAVSGPPAPVSPPTLATAAPQPPSRDPAPAGSEPTSPMAARGESPASHHHGPLASSRARSILPLAAWAHRADCRTLTADPAVPTDDLDEADGLLRGLLLPEHVAHISYPAGCRIQRVRIAGGRRRRIDEHDSDAPVVILSKRALRDTRKQSLTS